MRSRRVALRCFALASCTLPSAAQLTTRVSLTVSGVEAADGVTGKCGITSDGRCVMFESASPLFLPADNNAKRDVFVRELASGMVERVSFTSTGAEPTEHCTAVALSPDVRFVLLQSNAPGMTPNDTNLAGDGFVFDRGFGTLSLVTVADSGACVPGGGSAVAITPDAHHVLFSSSDATLVPGDTNGVSDVFVRERGFGTTERVSVDSAGAEGDDSSIAYAITPDGRFVVFASGATNLVPGDTNALLDVFVRDRALGTTERISVSSSGTEANGADTDFVGSISADGRFVAFASNASNLALGHTNSWADVFVRDRLAGTTTRVSVSDTGAPADHLSRFPQLTPDGRFVVFSSSATNLIGCDMNASEDVFVRDLLLGGLELVSVRSDGVLCAGGPLVRLRGRGAVAGEASFPNSAFANDATTTLSQRGGGL